MFLSDLGGFLYYWLNALKVSLWLILTFSGVIIYPIYDIVIGEYIRLDIEVIFVYKLV